MHERRLKLLIFFENRFFIEKENPGNIRIEKKGFWKSREKMIWNQDVFETLVTRIVRGIRGERFLLERNKFHINDDCISAFQLQ